MNSKAIFRMPGKVGSSSLATHPEAGSPEHPLPMQLFTLLFLHSGQMSLTPVSLGNYPLLLSLLFREPPPVTPGRQIGQ